MLRINSSIYAAKDNVQIVRFPNRDTKDCTIPCILLGAVINADTRNAYGVLKFRVY